MKQIGVSITCKFTKALPDGSFKSVTRGTDAQLEAGDNPAEARRLLYEEVAQGLRA